MKAKRQNKSDSNLPPIPDDSQLHAAVDDITKVECACHKVLESDKYDFVQFAVSQGVLRECKFAKESFVRSVEHIKEHFEMLNWVG
jgi:hypothetical protein